MKPMPWLLRTVMPNRFIAITLPPFGIYARKDYLDSELIADHEQVHWEQYQRLGALRYYGRYLWQSMTHGYNDNPMEVEAREKSSGKK